MDITIDNFHIKSEGTFAPIDLIPQNFKSFFKSKSSEYFTNKNKTKLIRISDHWGFNIKKCNWFLNGYDLCDCNNWRKLNGNSFIIGMINISKLKY